MRPVLAFPSPVVELPPPTSTTKPWVFSRRHAEAAQPQLLVTAS
jgi:hypothetical protein